MALIGTLQDASSSTLNPKTLKPKSPKALKQTLMVALLDEVTLEGTLLDVRLGRSREVQGVGIGALKAQAPKEPYRIPYGLRVRVLGFRGPGFGV